MSDIGGLVDELIAAGTPPGMAAQIVARAFAAGVESGVVRVTSRDESVTDRRETDRLRKQRWRDRHDLSRDNRDMSRDVTNASLSKESKKEENKEVRGERKVASRGQRLPDDWSPTAQDAAVAHTLIGPQRTGAELEKFRDHWKQQPGSKGVKLDWDAAWRNWIRRAGEYRGGNTQNGRRTVQDAAKDLHENLLERIAAFDEPAPRGIRDGTGQDVVRLLPARGRE